MKNFDFFLHFKYNEIAFWNYEYPLEKKYQTEFESVNPHSMKSLDFVSKD